MKWAMINYAKQYNKYPSNGMIIGNNHTMGIANLIGIDTCGDTIQCMV